jgi:hypothetical protein
MSDSSQTNKEDEIVDSTSKASSSSKQRVSNVYQYFTFNESTSRWHCDYCS